MIRVLVLVYLGHCVEVCGLGFGVMGLRVLKVSVWALWLRSRGSGFRVQGLGFRVRV